MSEQNPQRSSRRAGCSPSCILAAILAAIGIWIAVGQLFFNAPYSIVVDGKTVANVESYRTARDVLEKARVGQLGDVPRNSVRFMKQVSMQRAGKDVALVEIPEAVRALEASAPVEVNAAAIMVDDVPLIALLKEDQAEEALELTKKHYESKLNKLYSPSTFKEKVFIEERYVPADLLHSSPEEAARVLTSPADEPLYHTIERGDRGVYIARKYDISLDELKKLNPQVDINRLVESNKLLVRKATPPVTVVSKAMVTMTEKVTAPRGRRTGNRETRTLVTYENGLMVSKKVVSQVTTWNRPGVQ